MNASTFVGKWGLLLAVLLVAVGAGLLTIGLAGTEQAFLTVAGLTGLVFFAVAGVVMLWTVAIWIRRRRVAREFTTYTCVQCGYVPRLKDIETRRPFPCPRCGQLVYREV